MLLDRNLNGGYGATRIIASVTTQTTHLVLNHNRLGNGGARMLFHLLGKSEAKIEEIQLNSCSIGDEGMRWMIPYLRGNTTLETLYLNGNEFDGDPTIVSEFVAALNTSALRNLSLSTNSFLSDPFLTHFLPSLSAPYLRSLHMSMIGLTSASLPLLLDFLASQPAKHLDLLTLNANSLSYAGVQEIISCVEQRVTGLQVLELDGNTVEGEEESTQGAKRWSNRLKGALLRNSMLRAQVRAAALRTLRHARILLNARPRSHSAVPPLLSIPTELRLLVLRHSGDPLSSLSDSQFARVCDYATTWESQARRQGPRFPHGNKGKIRWLESVGCMYYEREPGTRKAQGVPERVELVGY
ncbi:RNI-like protein [Dacryopinax primogenitus]|uniref:RNI-like protein n=1 Tax=Dacryopinax primogenitus (strain DJM 731) TaxID=1858805 RepID=M5FWV1_DACPD|nr:RNI-like protein [Dacryopinax primogenitus]EJU02451.1 RNI-like protein [Dacryopinax primogenitus]